MAFRFKLDETATSGFRRIARSQLDLALEELSASAVQPVGVHACRKALKRLRALVRLVAPSLGRKSAHRHNVALRDIGRMMSERRDQAVLIETLAKLTKDARDDERDILQPMVRHFEAHAASFAGPLDPLVAGRARLLLLAEAKRFSKSRLDEKGFKALRRGLEESYRRGRKMLRAARTSPADEPFHELRKSVQTHWRQMSLLIRIWPTEIEARVLAARELSQLLGDDHDLAMLKLSVGSAQDITASQAAAFAALCVKRQAVLRRNALARAELLYAERPAAFAERMAAYWNAARAIAAAERASRPQKVPATPSNIPLPAPTSVPNGASGTPTLLGLGSAPSTVLAAKTPAKGPSQRRV